VSVEPLGCVYLIPDYHGNPYRTCGNWARDVRHQLCQRHARVVLAALLDDEDALDPAYTARAVVQISRIRRWLPDAWEQWRDESETRLGESAAASRAALPTLVYVVEREGFIKIGWTANLERRLKDLSRGSCAADGMTVGPVRLLFTIDGGRETERALHLRFAADRVQGEWFLPSTAMQSWIDEVGRRRAERQPA
jgi:hypothetical protein